MDLNIALVIALTILNALGWFRVIILTIKNQKLTEQFDEMREKTSVYLSASLRSSMMIMIASERTVAKLAGDFVHPEVITNTFTDFLKELDPEGTKGIDFNAPLDEDTKAKLEKHGLGKLFEAM